MRAALACACNNFIVKKSGTQAGIEPTTFGVLGIKPEAHLYRTWGYGTAHQYRTVTVPYVLYFNFVLTPTVPKS